MAAGPYNYSYIFKYIIIGNFLLVPWPSETVERLIRMLLPLLPFTGDMGVGKSCLLHQFTEKKCKL